MVVVVAHVNCIEIVGSVSTPTIKHALQNKYENKTEDKLSSKNKLLNHPAIVTKLTSRLLLQNVIYSEFAQFKTCEWDK